MQPPYKPQPTSGLRDLVAEWIRGETAAGIKVGGPDLKVLEQIAKDVEAVVKPLPGTLSAYAERVMGGSYLDLILSIPQP